MRTVKITEKTHIKLTQMIDAGKKSEQVPSPTYTSIIERLVCGDDDDVSYFMVDGVIKKVKIKILEGSDENNIG